MSLRDMAEESGRPKTYVGLLFLAMAGLVLSLLTYLWGTYAH